MDTKYYLYKDQIQVSDTGNVNTFPVFYKFTNHEKRDLNILLVKSHLNGFLDEMRSVYFFKSIETRLKVKTITDTIQHTFEQCEVDEALYNFVDDIPHWNPVYELGIILNEYNTLVEMSADSELSEVLYNKILHDIENEREIKYNA